MLSHGMVIMSTPLEYFVQKKTVHGLQLFRLRAPKTNQVSNAKIA